MTDTLINPPWYRRLLTWAETPSKARKVAIYCAGVLILLAAIFWAFSGSGGTKPEPANLLVNQGIDEGQNSIVSNLIANQEKVVNNAENNANQANANLANTVRRDSNSYSNNGYDADDAFCSRFPQDSSCADWRKRHGR